MNKYKHFCFLLSASLLLLLMTSCSKLITSTVVEPTVGNLQKQTDLELVCEGAPAYLLMVDSMTASDMDNTTMLRIGAQSYSGYLTALMECEPDSERFKALADKAHLYAITLLENYIRPEAGNENLEAEIAKLRKSQVPDLFWASLAWLSWIQQQDGAPAAMADLVVIQKIMNRVLELDPTFEGGGAHLFMGGYLASIPVLLGGKPEEAKNHFEKALELSDRTFLLVQVTYAEKYARMTFDKELHNSLLQEVMEFPLDQAPEFALSNQIAKRKAARLLADDYFLE